MWNEDDTEPQNGNALPATVRRAYIASRRPRIARAFCAGCAFAGGVLALFITVALTSGVCLGDETSCAPIGQATALFGLFTVPLGIAMGAVLAGNQVDRATRAYRPKM